MKTTLRQVIGGGACDPSGRMSLLGALTLVEDVVVDTLDKMEINGFKMRKQFGAVLVFSKNHVKFLQPIRWKEKVTVSCFISAKSVARLNVDVCVKNQHGEIALYARTEVCAVDVESARIRRLDAVGIGEKIRVYAPLVEMEWQAVDPAEQLVDTVTVRTANIDYAGHTNNVEYIRLLLNTFTLDEWRGGIATKELQVAYLNQSFLGDKLDIFATNREDKNTSTHERIYTIKKAEQDVLRCLIKW